MDDNVYKAPDADLGEPPPIAVPEDIRKKIKAGWIAALVSATWTLIVVIIAISSNTAVAGLFDAWALVDVVLIFALAFGIYKNSRFASTFMFAYFVLSKILIFMETGRVPGIILSLVFVYFFFQAMIGTYQYRIFVKTQTAAN